MELTDALITGAIALIGIIGSLACYIHTTAQKHTRDEFKRNDLAHEKLDDSVADVSKNVQKTRLAVYHIAKYHEGIPPIEEDDD